MDINEAIEQRRTIYPVHYTGEKVDHKVIERMMELANWAPTHRYTEPWRFHVFSEAAKDDLLDLCADCYVKQTPAETFKPAKVAQFQERKQQVSHLIAIIVDHSGEVPEDEELASVAMAVQNMWLYLASTPYAGYWSTPGYIHSPEFATYLKLEPNQRCIGLFYLGTPDASAMGAVGKRGDWKDKVKFMI